MQKLSETQLGLHWLGLFEDADERADAAMLIDKMLLVSRDDLVDTLRRSIESFLAERGDTEGPVALFAMRAVRKIKKVVQPFFRGHAPSTAAEPAFAPAANDGAITALIDDLVRDHGPAVLSHPDLETMRATKVGHIMIVTDFIGSGKRACEMLRAFRAVPTLRSWQSRKRLAYSVVAYSGTGSARSIVKSNPAKPVVAMLASCPSIDEFPDDDAARIGALCERYPQKHHMPHGFFDGRTLIAFQHGVPIDAPPILRSRTRGWVPLFQAAGKSGSELSFPPEAVETTLERRDRLKRSHDPRDYLMDESRVRDADLVLTTGLRDLGFRSPWEIITHLGVEMYEVSDILFFARLAGWLTSDNVLTELGQKMSEEVRARACYLSEQYRAKLMAELKLDG